MGNLVGLEGTNGREMEAVFIKKPSDIRKILRAGKGATTADDNGAINIWRDDEGMIRCDAMAYMRSLEKKKYKTLTEAEKWVAKWLNKIR